MNYAEVTTKILQQWQSRAETQGLKPQTVKYQKARLEFLLGAYTGLIAAGLMETHPPMLVLAAVGRPTEELFPKEKSCDG